MIKNIKFVNLLLISSLLILANCSKHENNTLDTPEVNNSKVVVQEFINIGSGDKSITTLKSIISLEDFEKFESSDFTNTMIAIHKSDQEIVLTAKMECIYNKSIKTLNCSSKADLEKLPPGIYRLLITNTQGGLLGVELFEIIPGVIPITLTIENEGTGFYLLGQITKVTHLSEGDIFAQWSNQGRLNSIKNLEETAYQIFINNNPRRNYSQGLQALLDTLEYKYIKPSTPISSTSTTLDPLEIYKENGGAYIGKSSSNIEPEHYH